MTGDGDKGVLALFTCVALLMHSGAASSQEVTTDQRVTARILARIEAPIASRNQRAYCEAFYGTEDYRGYVGRACELGVRTGVRKAEQCTPEAVSVEARADLGKCNAMDGAGFDAALVRQSEARAKFVRAMSERGIDGERLIAEERAKLR